ncbi:MAG: tRNA (adenosine(37)-N6)-dimethylallyltransferase MiaA [Gemmatimonadetes bacterium]|nr:tRNA (adenosine(37)-N6)-dimethylallyltransferase MiaA [Gemmatimonadota bacterium]
MADFLAIVGPTASGKTGLSLEVAWRLDAEIISMDSRQVYRGMDVGTAKVDAAARATVPHHGLDLLDPNERYSAGRFARDVRRWIREIHQRGHVPLLVGGTGFFLRALVEPIFTEPPLDAGRRESLRRWMRKQGRDRLATWVRRLDPERADLAVAGGPQRMSRTLEVALLTGRPLSRWHREAPPDGEPLRGLVVVLEVPAEELDRRISDRTRRMLAEGLLEEVRGLLDRGYGTGAPGMSGTGYRELARHLAGELTLEEALELMERSTRRYARRQRTWFRNQLPEDADCVVRVDGTAPRQQQLALVLDAWRKLERRPTTMTTGREEEE